jgi:hypothetical protein
VPEVCSKGVDEKLFVEVTCAEESAWKGTSEMQARTTRIETCKRVIASDAGVDDLQK